MADAAEGVSAVHDPARLFLRLARQRPVENINFHLLLSFAVTPPTLARLGTYRMLSAENPPIGFGAGKTEKWWIMGRSQDQFGPEGPEVSTSAHVTLRLYGTRQKADGLLEIRT